MTYKGILKEKKGLGHVTHVLGHALCQQTDKMLLKKEALHDKIKLTEEKLWKIMYPVYCIC